jgi:endoglucanase
MFAYFAAVDPKGPWETIWQGYLRAAPTIYAAGVAPDLYVVSASGAITQDTERTPAGSYDAIRVYLWAGMSGEQSRDLVRLLKPFAAIVETLGTPPENVDPATGTVLKADYSPIGFTGAVLPFLSALHEDGVLGKQVARLKVDAVRARLGAATNYYDQALVLFGHGWLDNWYRFDDQGRLDAQWLR